MVPRCSLLLLLLAAIFSLLAIPCAAHPKEYIVTMAPEAFVAIAEGPFLMDNGIKLKKSVGNGKHPIALVEMEPDRVVGLKGSAGVVDVEENAHVEMHSRYVQEVGNLWHLDNICKYDFVSDNGKYNYNFLGTGVDVYIFDTGINLEHEDFEGRASRFKTFTGSSCDDCNGHGTHVAGSVGGKVYGIAKNVTLYDVQVLEANGVGDIFTVITAIYEVSDHIKKNSVGVMSLGGSRSTALRAAALYARQHGLIISASSGNSNDDACYYSPGDSPDVVTVSAHDSKGRKASFSNYGSCVEVYAPGVKIRSAYIGSPTASAVLSGTSMAAPLVGGILATLLEQNPNLDFASAVEILLSQVKEDFIPTDAPATTSLVQAAPCLTYCSTTVIEMDATTNSLIEPAGGFAVAISGVLNAWLYFDDDTFPTGTFHFTLVRLRNGTVEDIVSSDPNINPLTVQAAVKEEVYAFRIDRVSSFGQTARFTLFSEPPLLCYDTVNCNNNGECNEDGSCTCFQGFYGADCSGNTVAFLFDYEMSLSSILFIVVSIIVVVVERRKALKKVQIDELSPLLFDDSLRHSTASRYSDHRH